MKKIIILCFLAFCVTTVAHATPGACSYHGGVNCSAGADWDGSVICNDGWTDSSVSYSSMIECQTTSTDVCSVSYKNFWANDYKNADAVDRSRIKKETNEDINSRKQQLVDLQNKYSNDVSSLQSSDNAIWQSQLQQIEQQRQAAITSMKNLFYAANPYDTNNSTANASLDKLNATYDQQEAAIRSSQTTSNAQINALSAQNNVYTGRFQSEINCLNTLVGEFDSMDNSTSASQNTPTQSVIASSASVPAPNTAQTRQIKSQLLNAYNVYNAGINVYNQAVAYGNSMSALSIFGQAKKYFDTASSLLLINPIGNYGGSDDLHKAILNLGDAVNYMQKATVLMTDGLGNSGYNTNKDVRGVTASQDTTAANSAKNFINLYFSGQQLVICPTNATLNSDGQTCACNSGTVFEDFQCVSTSATSANYSQEKSAIQKTQPIATTQAVQSLPSTPSPKPTTVITSRPTITSSTTQIYSSSSIPSNPNLNSVGATSIKPSFWQNILHYVNPMNWF